MKYLIDAILQYGHRTLSIFFGKIQTIRSKTNETSPLPPQSNVVVKPVLKCTRLDMYDLYEFNEEDAHASEVTLFFYDLCAILLQHCSGGEGGGQCTPYTLIGG